MRICKSKANLKEKYLGVSHLRNAHTINYSILDGCVILWSVAWPTLSPTSQALVRNYVESFKKYWQLHPSLSDVYLVLERSILCLKDTLNLVQSVQKGS